MAEAIGYRGMPPGPSNSWATPQQKRIFFASFMTLIASGVGFAVRAGVLFDWGKDFGFTHVELGTIAGAGLAGFGFTIIFFSFFADLLGYRALLLLAFALLMLSEVVTVSAAAFHTHNGAYWTLYCGTFIFSLAQGLCEAAINPLTATLFPREKTRYLNILHAGWPGGLMIGGLICFLFTGSDPKITHVKWEILSSLYVLPTLYFGFVALKETFPISEAKAAGIGLGQMIVAIAAPMLIFIFLIHAMVGYVELGTDSWIQNILNNTLGSTASLLFTYCSILMFILRFFAGPIVHKINPLGLLFLAACCGATGLYFLGANSTGWLIWAAATVFAIGKSFYWPTLLGVVGERFPRGGALAMGLSGGIGMLSAGFLGGPGIGYTYDRNASAHLVDNGHTATLDRVESSDPSKFAFFKPVPGIDGQKAAAVSDSGAQLQTDLDRKPNDQSLIDLHQWYVHTEQPHVEADKAPLTNANIYGGRQALKITAGVPAAMAVCFLILVLYFAAKGGYKVVHLDSSGHEVEVPLVPDEQEAIEATATQQA